METNQIKNLKDALNKAERDYKRTGDKGYKESIYRYKKLLQNETRKDIIRKRGKE